MAFDLTHHARFEMARRQIPVITVYRTSKIAKYWRRT